MEDHQRQHPLRTLPPSREPSIDLASGHGKLQRPADDSDTLENHFADQPWHPEPKSFHQLFQQSCHVGSEQLSFPVYDKRPPHDLLISKSLPRSITLRLRQNDINTKTILPSYLADHPNLSTPAFSVPPTRCPFNTYSDLPAYLEPRPYRLENLQNPITPYWIIRNIPNPEIVDQILTIPATPTPVTGTPRRYHSPHHSLSYPKGSFTPFLTPFSTLPVPFAPPTPISHRQLPRPYHSSFLRPVLVLYRR